MGSHPHPLVKSPICARTSQELQGSTPSNWNCTCPLHIVLCALSSVKNVETIKTVEVITPLRIPSGWSPKGQVVSLWVRQ